MYVSQAVLQAAYDDTGLALDFYKSACDNRQFPTSYAFQVIYRLGQGGFIVARA